MPPLLQALVFLEATDACPEMFLTARRLMWHLRTIWPSSKLVLLSLSFCCVSQSLPWPHGHRASAQPQQDARPPPPIARWQELISPSLQMPCDGHHPCLWSHSPHCVSSSMAAYWWPCHPSHSLTCCSPSHTSAPNHSSWQLPVSAQQTSSPSACSHGPRICCPLPFLSHRHLLSSFHTFSCLTGTRSPPGPLPFLISNQPSPQDHHPKCLLF